MLGIQNDWAAWGNLDFLSFVEDKGYFQSIKDTLTKRDRREHHLRFHLNTNQSARLLDAVIIHVYDHFHDFLGFLVIAREVEQLAVHLKQYKLTAREITVVEYIISGYSNREIADLLGLAERTIKAHITNIYSKLAISNKVQLFNFLNHFPPAREQWQGEERRKSQSRYLADVLKGDLS